MPSTTPPLHRPARSPLMGPARLACGGPRSLRRVVMAAVAVLVGMASILLGAAPASAHAELSGTDPASGSVLADSPTEIVLTFTESVAVEADGVRILDSDGKRRDAGTASSSGPVVTAALEGRLEQGGYVVAWRVVSADGHPINGAYQFSVGMRTQVDADVVDSAFAAASDSRDRQFGNMLRAIAYACTLVAAGATAVGARLRRPEEPSPVTRPVALLAGLGCLAILLQVPVQTSLMTGRGWGSVTEAGVLGRALSEGLGWAVGVSALGLVLIAITAGLPFRRPVTPIALTGSVLAPLGFVLFGHTRTMSSPVVAYLSDAAHLLAATVWFGGLVALLLVLHRRHGADDVVGAGEAVGSFSALAGMALAAVAASGLAMGWMEVGSIEALTDTRYGKLLLIKVVLVGVVALGGTWNRYRLVPHLSGVPTSTEADGEAGEPGATAGEEDAGAPAGTVGPDGAPASNPEQRARWSQLGRILRIEVAVLVAVVGVTGVLVNETPAKQANATVSRVEAPFGEGSMEVWLSPGRAGLNDVHVILLGADGSPDDRFDEAEFALSLPEQDVGPIEAEPVKIGPGHFQLVSIDLSIRGEWTVEVSVRPDRFTLTQGTASFRIR